MSIRPFTFLLALTGVAISAPAETVLAAARQSSNVGPTTVSAVQPTDAADVILLSSGFASGLRQGMNCSVTRQGTPIAELVLVDLRTHAAAALITQLAARETIRPGDQVTVKLQSN